MRRRSTLDPSAPSPEEVTLAEAIAGSRLAGLECGALIGAGSRCNVHAARLRDRDCALKIYRPRAIASHARRCEQPLAEYEYSMNRQYRARPALASHVAEPIDYLVTPRMQLFLQERLVGPLYYFWYQHASGADRERVRADIEAMVEAAHGAGIHGLNLHALNLIVVANAAGEPIPTLFDFIDPPRRLRHANRLLGLATRLGLITPERADYLTLAQLHDFRALERRLRRSGI
jgi:hypothetical protein